MSYNHKLPKKVSLKPKRHHGFQVLIFLLGCVVPPLAVAVRFGIGSDFFINVILTICGYIPGHVHNFYVQNIRNNNNKARTPKWAIRYGLVDSSERDRKARKSQWSKRYDERLPESTHVGQSLEDGEVGDNYTPVNEEDAERRRNEGLWTNDEEEYYNPDEAPNQRHWHYPANFEGAVGDGRSKRRTQEPTGDRWERTREARSNSASSGSYPPTASTDADVPEWGREYGSKRRSSKNKKTNAGGRTNAAAYAPTSNGNGGGNLLGDTDGWGDSRPTGPPAKKATSDDVFNHEF